METIKKKCPHCQGGYRITPEQELLKVVCPHCGEYINPFPPVKEPPESWRPMNEAPEAWRTVKESPEAWRTVKESPVKKNSCSRTWSDPLRNSFNDKLNTTMIAIMYCMSFLSLIIGVYEAFHLLDYGVAVPSLPSLPPSSSSSLQESLQSFQNSLQASFRKLALYDMFLGFAGSAFWYAVAQVTTYVSRTNVES